MTNKAARDYIRMLFAGASDETPDKQGRITHPADAARLRRRCDRDCVVIGAMNRVEIWDAEAWQTYSRPAGAGVRRLSEEVFPGV